MKENKRKDKDSGLEIAISWVLISGVIISVLLEIAGITVFYIERHSFNVSRDIAVFIRGNNFFSFIYTLFKGNFTANAGISLMTAGLLTLMLTPYLRVVLSLAFFGKTGNLSFVWITTVVLAVLTLSMAFH